MEIICYACGRGEFPENTIEAIQRCQNVDLDWIIEMDLQLTKDNEVILFHDYTTGRTTEVNRKINDLSLPEVMELNAGYYFAVKDDFPFRREPVRIPTLREVCHLFSNATLLLDVHTDNPGIVESIVEIIEETKKENSIIIVSKYDSILDKFKRVKPNWTYGAATNEVKKMVYSSFVFLDGLFPIQSNILMLPVKFGSLTLLTKRVLRHIKKRNKKIWVWSNEGKEVVTVNTKSEYDRLECQKVDGIFTEYPEKLNNEISELL